MKTLAIISVALLFCLSISNLHAATYSGGSGTAANPYRIATKADLLVLAGTTADYSKCFILMADIDLTGQTFTTAIIAPDTDSSTSGFQGTAFTGTFNGGGRKIANFTINGGSNDFLGLFGTIDTGGQIKNLGLENFTVSGSSDSWSVGGLVGDNNDGTIRNCSSTGFVSGYRYVGGLAGSNDGTINHCYSTSTVSGNWFTGGLVGSNWGDNVSNCYSTGTVSGYEYVGGLMGNYVFGTLTACYSMSDVTGTEAVGGLVGSACGFSYVTKCYSTGTVSGTSYVGGLIGDTGPLFFGDYTWVLACFWDTQASGTDVGIGDDFFSGEAIGKTTEEMKTLTTFTEWEWDFLGETTNGTDDIWRMCKDDVDYPKLTWEYIENGDFACLDGVAIDDLQRLSQDWLMTYSTALYGADANSDMTVNLNDFEILAQHWLEGI